MPRGLNRTDLNSTGTSYKDGTPVTLPHTFGTPIDLTTHDFGNPVTLPKDFGNDVTWPTPDPEHFGNIFPNSTSDLALENGTGVFGLENGTGVILLEM